jgi:hypothetical protein
MCVRANACVGPEMKVYYEVTSKNIAPSCELTKEPTKLRRYEPVKLCDPPQGDILVPSVSMSCGISLSLSQRAGLLSAVLSV